MESVTLGEGGNVASLGVAGNVKSASLGVAGNVKSASLGAAGIEEGQLLLTRWGRGNTGTDSEGHSGGLK